MFIEDKSRDGIIGTARIGRVTYSKTLKTLYYGGRTFQSLKGGYKTNYFDVETMDRFWISGCKADGTDALYPITVEIDADVVEEYWSEIRKMPGTALRSFKSLGKYRRN